MQITIKVEGDNGDREMILANDGLDNPNYVEVSLDNSPWFTVDIEELAAAVRAFQDRQYQRECEQKNKSFVSGVALTPADLKGKVQAMESVGKETPPTLPEFARRWRVAEHRPSVADALRGTIRTRGLDRRMGGEEWLKTVCAQPWHIGMSVTGLIALHGKQEIIPENLRGKILVATKTIALDPSGCRYVFCLSGSDDRWELNCYWLDYDFGGRYVAVEFI